MGVIQITAASAALFVLFLVFILFFGRAIDEERKKDIDQHQKDIAEMRWWAVGFVTYATFLIWWIK